MIAENDRINNEFYVDQVMKHCLELGMDVRVFEIERYIGWGTPKDYEEYQATIRYWKEFTDSQDLFREIKGMRTNDKNRIHSKYYLFIIAVLIVKVILMGLFHLIIRINYLFLL